MGISQDTIYILVPIREIYYHTSMGPHTDMVIVLHHKIIGRNWDPRRYGYGIILVWALDSENLYHDRTYHHCKRLIYVFFFQRFCSVAKIMCTKFLQKSGFNY